jgi:DNA-binding transcriptional ArsR family regulator
MIELSDIFRKRPEVTFRSTPSGALLVDLNTGQCWQLNELGADFLSQVDPSKSIGELCDALGMRYTVSQATLRHDILRLTEQLSDAGLIERASK